MLLLVEEAVFAMFYIPIYHYYVVSSIEP